ncbi:MAG: DUF4238 domain-containing protein [Alphaproteobacteria bacterium]|nr:MAG: DUF4238 domain-containing protein [Alphaproteobacteria bacterium]
MGMSIPRNHHFIPQFWLKRFSATGDAKLVWSYVWDADKIKERSVEKLMAVQDLYTRHTASGPDVSLETGELGEVDRVGSDLFRKLDAGDRSSNLREELADFFAVMALRHPQTVSRFPEATAQVLLHVMDGLNIAATAADFTHHMAASGVPVL